VEESEAGGWGGIREGPCQSTASTRSTNTPDFMVKAASPNFQLFSPNFTWFHLVSLNFTSRPLGGDTMNPAKLLLKFVQFASIREWRIPPIYHFAFVIFHLS